MILNMHIRNDFDRWIETDKKRVTTLCGKITATKFAGIPGVTPNQNPHISADGKDVGWCLKCCLALLEEWDNNDFMWQIRKQELLDLYSTAFRHAKAQILVATSPK